jgi:hypothetical protein
MPRTCKYGRNKKTKKCNRTQTCKYGRNKKTGNKQKIENFFPEKKTTKTTMTTEPEYVINIYEYGNPSYNIVGEEANTRETKLNPIVHTLRFNQSNIMDVKNDKPVKNTIYWLHRESYSHINILPYYFKSQVQLEKFYKTEFGKLGDDVFIESAVYNDLRFNPK